MVQVCVSCVCAATDVYPVLYEPQGRGGGVIASHAWCLAV